MGERLDPKEEFRRHLEENEGKLFDPEIEAGARRELEVGRKGDYTVLRPEASREKRMDSFPQGRLSKEEDLEDVEPEKEGGQMSTAEAIAEMAKMREEVEKHHFATNLTEKDLENAISELTRAKEFITSSIKIGEIKEDEIPVELQLTMDSIAGKYNITGTPDSLPEKIEGLIGEYTVALQHFQE